MFRFDGTSWSEEQKLAASDGVADDEFGIMVGTMLMTGWLAVVGVGVPLGLVPADALAFERAHALGSSLIGRVVLVGIVALPLWKGAHHTRHLFIDSGGGERDALVAPLLYLVATAGSLMAILAAVRI